MVIAILSSSLSKFSLSNLKVIATSLLKFSFFAIVNNFLSNFNNSIHSSLVNPGYATKGIFFIAISVICIGFKNLSCNNFSSYFNPSSTNFANS